MAKLYITEYAHLSEGDRGQVLQIPMEPGIPQPPLVIDADGSQSVMLMDATKFVRIVADTACAIAFAVDPTAYSNGLRLGADKPELFAVGMSSKLKVGAVLLGVAPVITSNGGGASAGVNVDENTTAVTTVQAYGDQAIAYTITGGADAAFFEIDPATGVLSFIDPPDYDNPQDSGTNNTYEVAVTATNSIGTDVQTITATIVDLVDLAPSITSDDTVDMVEGETEAVTVTATGEGTITFAITGGDDADLFEIVGATGVLSFVDAPAFDTPLDADEGNDYEVEVTATNAVGSDMQAITVTVTDAP